jgi:hypothetical protein
MPSLITRHRVKNYDTWRPHFDQHEGKRIDYGITNPRVYRNANDPNDLVLLFDVADEARAREFGQSVELRRTMETAGVEMSTASVRLLAD